MDQTFARILTIVKYLLLLVICGGFLGIGMQELVGVPWIAEQFHFWNYPAWLMYLTGFLQVAGAILTFYQPLRFYGGLILLSTMVGAVATHILAEQYNRLEPPLILSLLIVCLLLIEKKVK